MPRRPLAPEVRAAIREGLDRGWSLRAIAKANHVSHETVRRVRDELAPLERTAASPSHRAPPLSPEVAARAAALGARVAKAKRPRRARPVNANAPLLEVCRALLAEVQRWMLATPLPQLKAKLGDDASQLAIVIARLQKREATASSALRLAPGELAQATTSLFAKLRGALDAAGPLHCGGCGVLLRVALPAPSAGQAPPEAASSSAHRDLLQNTRQTLADLLVAVSEAEANGNESMTQRFGRIAAKVANTIARLESAVSEQDEGAVTVPAYELAELERSMAEQFAAIRARPLHCAECSRRHSVVLGTGSKTGKADVPMGR